MRGAWRRLVYIRRRVGLTNASERSGLLYLLDRGRTGEILIVTIVDFIDLIFVSAVREIDTLEKLEKFLEIRRGGGVGYLPVGAPCKSSGSRCFGCTRRRRERYM